MSPAQRDPEALQRQLLAELAELAELDRRREDSLIRIEGLRAQLPSSRSANDGVSRDPPAEMLIPASPASATAKVTLFRSLFRGRADVFPARFVSGKTGKTVNESTLSDSKISQQISSVLR